MVFSEQDTNCYHMYLLTPDSFYLHSIQCAGRKIDSAGFDIHKPKNRALLPGQVLKWRAMPTGPGKIKLRWKKEARSRYYIIERIVLNINDGQWEPVARCSKVMHTIEGVKTRSVILFQSIGF